MTKINELVAQALQKVKEIEERMSVFATVELLRVGDRREDATIQRKEQSREHRSIPESTEELGSNREESNGRFDGRFGQQ